MTGRTGGLKPWVIVLVVLAVAAMMPAGTTMNEPMHTLNT